MTRGRPLLLLAATTVFAIGCAGAFEGEDVAQAVTQAPMVTTRLLHALPVEDLGAPRLTTTGRPQLVADARAVVVDGPDFFAVDLLTGRRGWTLVDPAGITVRRLGDPGSARHFIEGGVLSVVAENGVRAYSIDTGEPVEGPRAAASQALHDLRPIESSTMRPSRGGLSVEAPGADYSRDLLVVEGGREVARITLDHPLLNVAIDAMGRIWAHVAARTSGDAQATTDGLLAYQVYDRRGAHLFNLESPQVEDAHGERALVYAGARTWRLVGF